MLLSDVCVTSDVCLPVAYIGPTSRTERPRKTKSGINQSIFHSFVRSFIHKCFIILKCAKFRVKFANCNRDPAGSTKCSLAPPNQL